MSDDLVEWLRGQLDDDQEKAIDGQRASLDDGWPFWVDTDDIGDYEAANAYRDHFKPSRVLREVEAGRKLIKRYENAVAAVEQGSISGWIRGQDDGYMQACLDAIKDRAEALSDRPGYREEWRLT